LRADVAADHGHAGQDAALLRGVDHELSNRRGLIQERRAAGRGLVPDAARAPVGRRRHAAVGGAGIPIAELRRVRLAAAARVARLGAIAGIAVAAGAARARKATEHARAVGGAGAIPAEFAPVAGRAGARLDELAPATAARGGRHALFV